MTKGEIVRWTVGLVATLFLTTAAAHASERWNMPTADASSNYHTENARLFAEAMGVCTGGALQITVHANGSLTAGDEIKRAVEKGAVPVGERLLSAHQDESAVFGFDSVPFLAPSFEHGRPRSRSAWPCCDSSREE